MGAEPLSLFYFALNQQRLRTHLPPAAVAPDCDNSTTDSLATPGELTPSPDSQVQWQVHHCPLTNMCFQAVINLLESELPPPTWAIFQPFSGIIIRDEDVNKSFPQPGKRARGLNLGEFPVGSCYRSDSVESGLSGDKFGEVGTFFLDSTFPSALHQ